MHLSPSSLQMVVSRIYTKKPLRILDVCLIISDGCRNMETFKYSTIPQ